MAGLVTMTEVKAGVVTLVDLLKMQALLDMKSDIENYFTEHPPRKEAEPWQR